MRAARESNKVLGICLRIIVGDLLDLVSLTLGDLHRCVCAVLRVGVLDRRVILVRVREDLVTWLGEVELLLLFVVVAILVVSVAESGRDQEID